MDNREVVDNLMRDVRALQLVRISDPEAWKRAAAMLDFDESEMHKAIRRADDKTRDAVLLTLGL